MKNMSMSEKRTINAVLVLAVALLLPLLYLGSYWALINDGIHSGYTVVGASIYLEPTYKVGGDAAEFFYWPAHMLDKRLRPNRWQMDNGGPNMLNGNESLIPKLDRQFAPLHGNDMSQ